jgi:3-methylcrotonyl-CoA carboxylase alpha subunit
MRTAMGDAAVNAARAIGYKGAGTIEFIVDASDGLRVDRFWFMEMNTRLQVEHPVTEAITGVDLVEWQLRVASGEHLPLRQQDLTIKGHAFEARLYAEDVLAGFLPATGRLDHLVFPCDARADSGVRAGDTISPWYDPMIAKIITHGPSRAVALSKLSRALVQTQVAGSVTNLAFLVALTRHQGFGQGDVDTGLIGRDLDALIETPIATAPIKALAALEVAKLPNDALAGFFQWNPLRQTILLRHQSAVCDAMLELLGPNAARVTMDGQTLVADRKNGLWHIDGAIGAKAMWTGASVTVFAPECAFSFFPMDPLAKDAVVAGDGRATLSPMPGMVKAVFVVAGQTVTAGDRLCVLEAMKMEHTLTATRDGVVAEVLASADEQVEAGVALILLEGSE